MGDGEGNGVKAGSNASLTTAGGARLGEPVLGGTAGGELYLGNLPGGFDLNPLFFGDYTITDFGAPGRQDPALLPRDAYLRVDQRFITLRAGRIPFIGGNIRSVDGAEIFFKPIPEFRLGGFVGMRNETSLTPERTLAHRYRGLAYGASVDGGHDGFDARAFYRGIHDEGIHTRQDVGGSLNWRIIPELSVYGRAMGSLLLQELENAEGGVRGTWGPVTLSGYYKWNDPSLLYFDADDPWIVFAGQPNWRTGGDVLLRLLGGALLVNAGGYHGSLVDYGIDAGAQYGTDDFVRTDFSYARNGTVLGGGDSITAWLTGGVGIDRFRTEASVGYLEGANQLMPLYSDGQAVGFLLTAGYDITDSLNVSARFNGNVSDRPFQYTGLLFLQWTPEIGRSEGTFGRGMGRWEEATVVDAQPPARDEVSWIVIPVQIIDPGTVEAEAITDRLHSYHADGMAECVDCHTEVKTSRLSSDNLAVVNCDGCHDDGRVVKVTIPSPRINFPHQTHVTDQDIACERCHPGVEKVGLATRDHLPGMSVCTSCHVTWRNECAKCHPAGPSGRMQSVFSDGKLAPNGSYGIDDNHDLQFRSGEHRHLASVNIDYCLNCHGLSFSSPQEPKGCQECHDPRTISTDKKHPAGWIAYHPTMASRDPSSCQTCHGQSFCTDCHASQSVAAGASTVAPRSYHPAGWLGTGGGTHAGRAAASALSCSPCHSAGSARTLAGGGQGTTCISCHGTIANPHGSGMGGRLDRLRSVNPNLCKQCHTDGVR